MLSFDKKTIGIFGGSFDPPHKGHVEISKISLKKIKLKKIYWIVTKKNPLKKKPFFSLNQRISRSKKAIKSYKKIKVLYLDDKIIGRTTSGNYSFCFDKNLSFGYVNSGNTIDTLKDKNLFIEVEKIKYPVEILSKPLNTKDFRRA